ncbi:DUF1343 domain-containing protein [bacterium]|nr:DUF1343 domain-containing protein [bacterium]
MTKIKVTTGIDSLLADGFSCLKGRRVGLLTHAPACDFSLTSTLQHFKRELNEGLKVVFTPEHGYFGQAQDLESVTDSQRSDGLRWVTLFKPPCFMRCGWLLQRGSRSWCWTGPIRLAASPLRARCFFPSGPALLGFIPSQSVTA